MASLTPGTTLNYMAVRLDACQPSFRVVQIKGHLVTMLPRTIFKRSGGEISLNQKPLTLWVYSVGGMSPVS